MAAFCVSVYVRCQCHFRLPPTVHPQPPLPPTTVLNLPAAVDGCRFCCTVVAFCTPLAIDHAARARCPRKYVQTQSCSRCRSLTRTRSRSRSRSQSASQLPQHGKRDSMFHVVFSWLWLWLWARYSFTKRYPFRCFAHINKHTHALLSLYFSFPPFIPLSLYPSFFHTHANWAHSSTS